MSAPVPAPDVGVGVVTVVGIGADGWPGLGADAQDALRQAEVVIGAVRQLDLLGPTVTAARASWPTPMLAGVGATLERYRGRRIVVLASGDPLFFGVGSTLVGLLGAAAVRTIPHPSSLSLACARLGWAVEDVDVVSLVGRPLQTLHPAVQPGRRLLVLVSESDAARHLCALLVGRGYGASAVIVLEQLGGAAERIRHAVATSWAAAEHDRLAVVAVECASSAALAPLPRCPGLPDAAFDHDGQLTKREVRAVTLAALGPVAGQLLWDVGAGSGSVGIEWMRTHGASRAIAIESDPIRTARIGRNASSLGVPLLAIVEGTAPDALAGLEAPDAIFVGGGAGADGVLETCVQALRVGGRLVVNAVTLQSETLLAEWHARLGGALVRISVQHAEPIGAFTGWRPSMPVTQWAWHKEQP